jgi:hypothetical protein
LEGGFIKGLGVGMRVNYGEKTGKNRKKKKTWQDLNCVINPIDNGD